MCFMSQQKTCNMRKIRKTNMHLMVHEQGKLKLSKHDFSNGHFGNITKMTKLLILRKTHNN